VPESDTHVLPGTGGTDTTTGTGTKGRAGGREEEMP
jgi:hypothetical protein